MMHRPEIVVVGAGLAGLAAAHRLAQRGASVRVFEATERVGGVVDTVAEHGYVVDTGPNTLVARGPEIADVIDELGLRDRVVRAPASAARRYVVRSGRPIALPTSPLALICSPLFRARTKLRLLREPLIRTRSPADETITEFVRRRLGDGFLTYAVEPFVAGIYAGDPDRLLIRYALPALHDLEARHGSLVAGGMKSARASAGADRTPFGFQEGMVELTRALASALGDRVETRTEVVSVVADEDGAFTIRLEGDLETRTVRADAVIMSGGVDSLVRTGLATGSEAQVLSAMPSASVGVLALGFRRDHIAHPLDGFGVLVPRTEPFRMLGALFSSTLFPGRAPEGRVLLTCFAGGRRRPDDAALPKKELVQALLPDLRALLGARGEPEFVRHQVWPSAIPQYEKGYERVLGVLAAIERRTGVVVVGNLRGGVSVPDVIGNARAAASRLLGELERRSG